MIRCRLSAISATDWWPPATSITKSCTSSLDARVESRPLSCRNTAVASHPRRLLPSTRGWFFTSQLRTRVRAMDARDVYFQTVRGAGSPKKCQVTTGVGRPIDTRRPRQCSGRSWRWWGEQSGEARYARRPSQRTVTPSSSGTRNSGSPVRTGQSSTDAAPAAKASA